MTPEPSTKKRHFDKKITFPPIRSSYREEPFQIETPSTSAVYRGRQETVSIGHRKNHKGKYDSGGPFFTCRINPSPSTMNVSLDEYWGQGRFKYSGPVVMPIDGSDANPIFSIPSQDGSHLDKVGAEAISIINPTNANAQLGVSLGEIIHDKGITLPGIAAWRDRTKVAKAAGSEYLSSVFGYLPLVSEIKASAQSVRDGNRIMENYKAAAGTLVHREFAFDDIITEDYAEVGSGRCQYSTQGSVPSFHSGNVPIFVRRKTTTSRWFSGSFTYASTDSSAIGRCLGLESEADKLFGISLTPDVLWELAPWSWAIDWFSDAGNVISNATDLLIGGLVIKYGYIMEKTSTEYTYEMPSSGLTGYPGPPPPFSVTNVTKRRVEANPFGFGIGWEGLSPTQLAITAALGITRLSK